MESIRITVPNELFAPSESSYFEGVFAMPVLKAGPDLYDFPEPLSWQVTITNTGGALLVVGTVEGSAKTSCARCLDTFEFPVTGEIEGYFLLSEETAVPDEMDEDEFEYLPKDSAIDLAPLIQAAILLELPLIPLCDDECKGLCPACGADLNEGDCGCRRPAGGEEDAAPARENPFAVLKDFPFEGIS